MLLDLLITFAGFIVLLAGADRFVLGAGATARNFGVPPMLIGLTIVGFATSAPEILVSVTAAVQGLPNLAIGNALGSNVANIGLVLGVSALVKPIYLSDSVTLRQEMPLLLAVPIFTAIFFYTGDYLSRLDGLIMLVGLGVFLFGWRDSACMRLAPTRWQQNTTPKFAPTCVPLSLLPGSLLDLFCWSPDQIFWSTARKMWRASWVSAICSWASPSSRLAPACPNLRSLQPAAFKGEAELALGNIIGSNIFNLLAVVGLAVVIRPVALDSRGFIFALSHNDWIQRGLVLHGVQ